MKMLKLTTSPPITRKGRHRDGAGGGGASAATSVVFLAPWTPPEKKMTGSTGKMHGDIPVINPPKNPMRASESTVSSKVCRRGFGADAVWDWAVPELAAAKVGT
ncbi:hypothetical protein GCM10027056_12340 [Glaciibacter psychrotolerans]